MSGEVFDYEFDKALDNTLRLRIMSILVVNDRVNFSTVKSLLKVTDGNLASHINKLEQRNYITISKEFYRKKPRTSYSATLKGKKAFEAYLEEMEKLIHSHK